MVSTNVKDMVIQKSVSLPMSVMEAIQEECEISNFAFSRALVILISIGISERNAERCRDAEEKRLQEIKDRDKKPFKSGFTDDIVIKECPKELTRDEQAEMDTLLDAEPSEDLEKNKVNYKKVKA